MRYYGVTRPIYSTCYLNCHTWIEETGHSIITLLLQLNYGLHNSYKIRSLSVFLSQQLNKQLIATTRR